MPIEAVGQEIRARIKEPSLFIDSTFRTKYLSESQGIYSIMGKLKSDPNGGMVIQAYRFKKDKGWTLAKVKAWIKSHKLQVKAIEIINEIFRKDED